MVKRALDIALGAVAALILSPLLAAIAIYIRSTSPGPILHWSRRIGKDNIEFWMPKFRTMKVETPQVATHLLNAPGDWIIPGGAFLRRSSLDELPQLYSILCGDLSFVGPRPALFNQHDLVTLRTHNGVHRLLPGLTGWAQINGRDELPIPKKVELDCYYLNNRSISLDFLIILRTIRKAWHAEGVSH